MNKDLLSIADLTVEEMQIIFRRADELRKDRKRFESLLKGKILAMIFEKPSTRTRVSFEVAMRQLGGSTIYMNWNETQLGRGESIKDTAKTLERYVDGIVARVFRHIDIQELAENSKIPVINGLSGLEHPCQALADIYTIRERKKPLKGLKFAYIGDGGSNVAHSLMLACTKLGMDFYMACPERYSPDKEILRKAQENARLFWGTFKIVPTVKQAANNADIIYTDTWVSMGEEEQERKRVKELRPYQVNSEVLSLARKDCLVMHCLPAHRGREITDEVMDGMNFVGFDQAENRLHVQKAILTILLREPPKQVFRMF
ncbi:MAG: ornithine carbamoyltransferase [Candidatus Aenigmatarchaeota archaeon]